VNAQTGDRTIADALAWKAAKDPKRRVHTEPKPAMLLWDTTPLTRYGRGTIAEAARRAAEDYREH
jgi:hypothetical protein